MNRSGFRRRLRRRGPRSSRRSNLDRRASRGNIFTSAFNSMQSTVVRLCTTFTVSSSGAGTVANLVSCDPFASSFTEYTSDFANLYNQFRLVGSRIQIVSIIEGKGDTAILGIGYQNRQTGLGTPTSLANVVDNQPSWLWAISTDTSPYGFKKSQAVSGLLYSATSASSNTSTDSSGAPGGWQLYGTGFPASTNVGIVKLEIWLEFRSRS